MKVVVIQGSESLITIAHVCCGNSFAFVFRVLWGLYFNFLMIIQKRTVMIIQKEEEQNHTMLKTIIIIFPSSGDAIFAPEMW